jgi:ketosteroid isomerase-like protein
VSQENVEVVRRGYEAWADQDPDAFVELVASEFEFRPFIEWVDLEEVYRGPEGWRSFVDTWEEAWGSVEVAIETLEDLDDRVLALVRFDRIGKQGGTPVSIDVGHIWTIRDGKVTELLALPWHAAREVAGLSKQDPHDDS